MYLTNESTLAPATVVRSEGPRVLIRRDGGDTWARLALSLPYEPVAGDRVLAIGEDEVYVIGLLSPPKGKVSLRSETAVEIEAPQVTIRADRLETTARAAFERFIGCYRWVKELLQTRAGRSRTVVDGHSTLRAERIVEIAKEDVKIDGAKIHLG